MNEGNKKLKDTKVGEWLSDKAPKILDVAGDLLPDAGVLGIVKRLVDSDPEIPAQDKLEFERIRLQNEVNIQEQVTRRWEADMNSDVKIAKIIRPSIMIYLIVFFSVVTIWDSVSELFVVRDGYVDLLQYLLLTVLGAYFTGRTIEKSLTKK
jgi:hypothetical protein